MVPIVGLLGTTVPYADFADFWSRVAGIYKTNAHVIFNLVNEPANMLTEHWLDAANAAKMVLHNDTRALVEQLMAEAQQRRLVP